MKNLIKKLESLNSASPDQIKLLKTLFVPVSFRKGTLFHRHELASPMLYFIEAGLVRGYFFYQQEEYTAWLMDDGFLLPAAGFFTKEPAIEFVEFLTDTSGSYLNLEIVAAHAQQHPQLYRMLLEIYEENLYAGKGRELMLRLKSAEDRFLYNKKYHQNGLIEKYINRIASSFLHMEEKYFSKIRNKYKR